MAQAIFSPKARFWDADGNPLAGGKLFSYEAGTTTPQETYTDASGSTPNANPVILDANGEADIWVGNGTYKFTLKNAADVVQWTADNFDLSVSTAKIDDGAVTTVKIADSNVTTGKINNLAVTTAKIANNNVTRAKLEALGHQVSSSSGNFTTSSTSYVDVTNLSVTITTSGRPVFVGLMPDGTANSSLLGTDRSSGSTLSCRAAFAINRAGVDISITEVDTTGSTGGTGNAFIPPGSIWLIDPVAAGTYTYKITAKRISSSSSAYATYMKLVAYEL